MSTRVRHGTLTPDVEDAATYELTTTGLGEVTTREVGITHKANITSAALYARIDGSSAAVEDDDSYAILPGRTRWIPRPVDLGPTLVVSLISTAAVDWEVEIP